MFPSFYLPCLHTVNANNLANLLVPISLHDRLDNLAALGGILGSKLPVVSVSSRASGTIVIKRSPHSPLPVSRFPVLPDQ